MRVALFNLLLKGVSMLIEPNKIIKYYRLDNTGFTNGTSWFDGHRYSTFDEVKEAYKERGWTEVGDFVKWRIVEVTIIRYFQDKTQPLLETQKVTQERYLYVKHE